MMDLEPIPGTQGRNAPWIEWIVIFQKGYIVFLFYWRVSIIRKDSVYTVQWTFTFNHF